MKKEMSVLDTLCADTEKEMKKHGVLSPDMRVCVALSGGADSVALLYVLNRLLPSGVSACHVNHGIRGEEADRDEEFCRTLCEKLGVSFKAAHVDVPAECRKSGEGLEECARRLRYAELETAKAELGCRFIATAHHADDNIETVLMHIIRGCGLQGLTGIPFVRGNLLRPLLTVSRERIVRALESEGIEWVYDSTNSDLEMSRNLIRHTILPQIYKLNPSADTAFRRMCDTASEDLAFINGIVDKVKFDSTREQLASLDTAVLSRYIRRRYEAFGGSQIERDQIGQICSALKKRGENFKFELSGEVTAYVDRIGLAFVRENGDKAVENMYKIRLNFGENIISPCGYKIFITQDKNVSIEWQNIYKLSTTVSVISDKILCSGDLGLYARSRKAGDRYVFGGFERDVRKQLIKHRVPEYKRKNLPCIVTEEDEIIFVPGLRINDAFRGKGEAIYIVIADENIYG